MQGVQEHIESPRQALRSEGMITGEHLMNWLLPEAKEPLRFQCEDSPGTKWLKGLMRPLDEQVDMEVEAGLLTFLWVCCPGVCLHSTVGGRTKTMQFKVPVATSSSPFV